MDDTAIIITTAVAILCGFAGFVGGVSSRRTNLDCIISADDHNDRKRVSIDNMRGYAYLTFNSLAMEELHGVNSMTICKDPGGQHIPMHLVPRGNRHYLNAINTQTGKFFIEMNFKCNLDYCWLEISKWKDNSIGINNATRNDDDYSANVVIFYKII